MKKQIQKNKTVEGLNKEQLAAVTAPMGPVLILAGAGSGKTRALTLRIVYLVRKLGLRPHNILAVTFTNKAAGEMKERIVKLLSKEEIPTMGTFHSIGVRIIREQAEHLSLDKNFVIYDDDDQESLIKDILIEFKIDPTKFKPAMFGHVIDKAKNNLEEPDDIDEGEKAFNVTAKRVYIEYQKRLEANNAVDFGDLIMKPVKLFQKHPDILEAYQDRWKYMLIDEYQDTNYAQYMMSKLLAAKNRNIFVVGDDAQAIYGFRGANLQNILDFEKDYPETVVIKLEQNYRSTAPILSIAEKIIELSPRQHKKKLWTENLEGEKPMLYRAEDEMAEAWFVSKKIIEHQDGEPGGLTYQYEDESILSRIMRKSQTRVLPKLKNRRDLNKYAVLYRTHVQSRALEEMLIEAGIPYQIVGGLKFYERREIKDLLSYLRLIVNPNDIIGMKRVINVPPRGIGGKSFNLLKDVLIEKNDQELAKLMVAKPAIKSFFEVMDTIRNLDEQGTLTEILSIVLKLTGYEHYLRDGSEEGEGRFENVQELFNVATSFSGMPWKEGLVKFLEEVALMTNVDEMDPNAPKVTLMTLHQAKGLEFDIVFFVGLEEGILPHARSILDPKEIAEEVRLAYVGITRARKRLYLVHSMTRKQYGSRNMSVPSRFLKAIPSELLDVYEVNYD
ncbi:MAG: UvrD-helicase domain-containing protein [Candidatus Doudnabacteria bacterium]|nr:UvrD-helicase domain-containing protein [Candidatus Doudnabacteria bacterium]